MHQFAVRDDVPHAADPSPPLAERGHTVGVQPPRLQEQPAGEQSETHLWRWLAGLLEEGEATLGRGLLPNRPGEHRV